MTCSTCGRTWEAWRERCPVCVPASAAVATAPAPITQRFLVLLVLAVALVGYVGCWRPLQDAATADACGTDATCYRARGATPTEAADRANAAASDALRR